MENEIFSNLSVFGKEKHKDSVFEYTYNLSSDGDDAFAVKRNLIEDFGKPLKIGDVVLLDMNPIMRNGFSSHLCLAPIAYITKAGLTFKVDGDEIIYDDMVYIDSEYIEVCKLEITPEIQRCLDAGCKYDEFEDANAHDFNFFWLFDHSEILLRDYKVGDLAITFGNDISRFSYVIVVGEDELFDGNVILNHSHFCLIENPTPEEEKLRKQFQQNFMRLQLRKRKHNPNELQIGDVFAVNYLVYIYIGSDMPYQKEVFLALDTHDARQLCVINHMRAGTLTEMEVLEMALNGDIERIVVNQRFSFLKDYYIGNYKIPFTRNSDIRAFIRLLKQRVDEIDQMYDIREIISSSIYDDIKYFYRNKVNKVYLEYSGYMEQELDDYLKKSKSASKEEMESLKKEHQKKMRSLRRKREYRFNKLSAEYNRACNRLNCGIYE